VKVSLGSDHAGLRLKNAIAAFLAKEGHEVIDCGTEGEASCDYPEFALRAARSVQSGESDRGILVCATGVGMSICANKLKGIRASLCNDLYTARFSRLHNDANVLCLGERVIGPGLALEIVGLWMRTPFEGGRHQRRLDLIRGMESGD
jgi:ribose 5-phosphate isomerase B